MPTLHWLNREESIVAGSRVPYRLLEADPKLSYGDQNTENMLIQGDNLHALKALLPYYAGKVKCIYIDPPYNTKSAFEHYDDNLEHTKWLEMMYPRLELLRELLAEDGSIWVTIDDNEAHYLKVIMDEIFGRSNFVANIVWQKFHSVKTNAQYRLSTAHDHILIFKKNALQNFNFLDMSENALKVYKNPDKDPRGVWRTAPLTVSLLGGARGEVFAKTGKSTGLYEIIAPNGKKHLPSKGRCWISQKGFEQLLSENKIWWGKDGNAVPMRKLFLSESGGKKICNTFWTHTEVGSNKAANEEQRTLFKNDTVFSTPKPERLLERIIHLASNENDLILDSFLGSGTTAAVAHKMGRRYIGIEMGEHAQTHCAIRLQKVVDGEQGGISKAANWKGGGGYRFYRLGEPIFDIEGKINPDIRFQHLAAHIWFSETRLPFRQKNNSPLLGIHHGIAYYLLYNGILGDKRPDGGNVLTSKIIENLPKHNGAKVIYGETTRLSAVRLKEYNITFKQTPYDIKAR